MDEMLRVPPPDESILLLTVAEGPGGPVAVVAVSKVWDGLDPDTKEMILDAAAYAVEAARHASTPHAANGGTPA